MVFDCDLSIATRDGKKVTCLKQISLCKIRLIQTPNPKSMMRSKHKATTLIFRRSLFPVYYTEKELTLKVSMLIQNLQHSLGIYYFLYKTARKYFREIISVYSFLSWQVSVKI